ncbi:hypothetical protein L6164_023513 [Bauhinia variegata]|uniref:Uncharacterized protein n=1 Tax=Bauhinia variegata TaxID=167791 RepID=A0ACB9MJZ6_BAUVA|nr:hypothetical protein L6164_023513 [Bauhinia variegata]
MVYAGESLEGFVIISMMFMKGGIRNRMPLKGLQLKVYVLNPKQHLYGLGFDPYKNAPEFREKKRSRVSGERGPGYNRKDSLFGFKCKILSFIYKFPYTYFPIADCLNLLSRNFVAPVIPKDFLPHHKFPEPLEIECKHYDVPPQEVPPPEDGTLKLLIEGVASLVARSGNFGRHARSAEIKVGGSWTGKCLPSVQRLTAESRGKILGEKPLEKSFQEPSSSVSSKDIHLQLNLSDTFTKSASFLIGRTPLLYLNKITKGCGAYITVKQEMMQPTASIKDRPALFMLKTTL